MEITHMSTELTAVKVKIAKLLALGESNSRNEATVAMQRAMRLMEEWGLEISDIELANQDIVKHIITTNSKRWPELRSVMNALARFCSVKIWSTTAGKYSGNAAHEIHLLGYEEDTQLFEYFWNMLNSVYTSELRVYKKSGEYKTQCRFYHGRSVRADFRNGFVSAVNYSLDDLFEDMQAAKTNSGTALVPLKMGNIEQFFEDEFDFKLTSSRGSRSGYGGAGHDAGNSAGAGVRFNAGVGGSTSSTKLLT